MYLFIYSFFKFSFDLVYVKWIIYFNKNIYVITSVVSFMKKSGVMVVLCSSKDSFILRQSFYGWPRKPEQTKL